MKRKTVTAKNAQQKPRPKRAKRSKSVSPNKNNGSSVQRCKQWLLEQKTIKNKAEPMEDSLDSDESDEFVRIKLEPEDDGVSTAKTYAKKKRKYPSIDHEYFLSIPNSRGVIKRPESKNNQRPSTWCANGKNATQPWTHTPN